MTSDASVNHCAGVITFAVSFIRTSDPVLADAFIRTCVGGGGGGGRLLLHRSGHQVAYTHKGTRLSSYKRHKRSKEKWKVKTLYKSLRIHLLHYNSCVTFPDEPNQVNCYVKWRKERKQSKHQTGVKQPPTPHLQLAKKKTEINGKITTQTVSRNIHHILSTVSWVMRDYYGRFRCALFR